MPNDWITVEEAARLGGYHPEHVRRIIREGKVEARKFSIVWMVSKESLLEYLRQQKRALQEY